MPYHDYITRRWFLKECGVGLGTIVLHALLQDRAALAQGTSPSAAPADPLAPREPHFRPKAKNVIYLFMAGGPSHLELFDNKPALARYNGTVPPAGHRRGEKIWRNRRPPSGVKFLEGAWWVRSAWATSTVRS